MTSRAVEAGIVSLRTPPAKFEAWPAEVSQRAQAIWSSLAGRSAARTAALLLAEADEGVATPPAATIARWARESAWGAQADDALQTTRGRTTQQIQQNWLAGLLLAQEVLLDAMVGRLDHLPYGGTARIKSAEIVLRVLERAGPLVALPDPAPPSDDAFAKLSAAEQSKASRSYWAEEGERRERRP
jgi:hypothetical protein